MRKEKTMIDERKILAEIDRRIAKRRELASIGGTSAANLSTIIELRELREFITNPNK